MQFASHEETHPALRRKRANVTANTSRRSTKPQEERAEFQRQQVRNRMRCHALLCWKEGAVVRGKKEDYHECSSTVNDGKDCKEDIVMDCNVRYGIYRYRYGKRVSFNLLFQIYLLDR